MNNSRVTCIGLHGVLDNIATTSCPDAVYLKKFDKSYEIYRVSSRKGPAYEIRSSMIFPDDFNINHLLVGVKTNRVYVLSYFLGNTEFWIWIIILHCFSWYVTCIEPVSYFLKLISSSQHVVTPYRWALHHPDYSFTYARTCYGDLNFDAIVSPEPISSSCLPWKGLLLSVIAPSIFWCCRWIVDPASSSPDCIQQWWCLEGSPHLSILYMSKVHQLRLMTVNRSCEF